MKTIESPKQKIASLLFKGVRVYLILNVLCFAFLLFSLYMAYNYDKLYSAFLFSFDAPYSDFKLWYPRFYFPAYMFILGIKILVISLFLALLYFLYTLSEQRKMLFRYNQETSYVPFIKREGLITLAALGFYLILYYLARFFIPKENFGELQLLIARGFLLHIIVQSVIVVSVHFDRVKSYMRNFLLLPSLPHNIAVLRILFFFYLIRIYFSKYNSALPTVSLPTKVSLPYMGWFIHIIPVNADLYTFFVCAGFISCLFIVIGFKTRWFLVANAVCAFYVIATPNFFGKLWHEQIFIWISWFFAFSRCYDVFSLDAWLDKRHIMKSADYTFPVRFVWLTFGIIYFWAGFYKLWESGFDWALGRSMVNQVQLEWAQNYDLVPAVRIDKYPVLLYLGGLAAILFELGYFLFILKPKLRWVAAIGGLLMHNTIGYFMYISFFHGLQVFYAFYVDFSNWFKTKTKHIETRKGYSKLAFSFGILILSANFYCGMFSIDSYPFSAYPKYAVLIPDSLKIIQFDVTTETGTKPDVHQIGKKNRFRWEDYGWLENNLIRDYEKGEDVSARLQDYWLIWENYNPELKNCKSVDVYIVERPVVPEGKDQLKTIHHIGLLK